MEVILKDIDEDNWIECIFLTTNKDNKHYILEEFVASNAVSIAQSKIEQGWTTKAFYNEKDTMIGFTMYGYNHKYHFFEICRIMIDYKYQGQGYGMIAMKKIIEQMAGMENCKEIYLSFDPKNHHAKRLYKKLGFVDTGRMIENEQLYYLGLE